MQAKEDFVHEMVRWGGPDCFRAGTTVLDVGCGIGGSSRILARDYGCEVTGVTISPSQIKRARELTPPGLPVRFLVDDAMALSFPDASFDVVWSVEAGPHMPDKAVFARELMRVLKPGGLLVLADWNQRDDRTVPLGFWERPVMRQLLDQWSHPAFSSIEGFSELLEATGLVDGQRGDGRLDQGDAALLDGVDMAGRPSTRRALCASGCRGFIKSLREVPTFLLMRLAFGKGLCRYGMFRARRAAVSAAGRRLVQPEAPAHPAREQVGGQDCMADAQVRRALGIKQFFGLSRMTHSVLDVAHPAVGGALAAVLLGGPPSARTDHHGARCRLRGLHLGLRAQRRHRREGGPREDGEVPVRPRNLRSRLHGAASSPGPGQPELRGGDRLGGFWGLLSLVLAFLLRPACAALLLGAFILETAYCKLLRVTHWKGLLSGLMVGVGGLAGVWAVTPAPRARHGHRVLRLGLRLGNRRQEHSQRLERPRGGPAPRHQDRPRALRPEGGLVDLLRFRLRRGRPQPALSPRGSACRTSVLYLPAPRPRRRAASRADLALAPPPDADEALRFFNMACFYPLAVFGWLAVAILV